MASTLQSLNSCCDPCSGLSVDIVSTVGMLSGQGSPIGLITATLQGQLYTDLASGTVYVFTGIVGTSAAWMPINTVNVIALGARADYVPATGAGTDSSTAIQAALDLASLTGLAVYIPGGRYKLDSAVVLKRGGIRLFGDASAVLATSTFGNMGTVLHVTAATYGIVVGNAVNSVEGQFQLENLALVGSATALAGIRVGSLQSDPNTAVSGLTVRNVVITGFTSSTAAHTLYTGQTAIAGAAGIYLARGVWVRWESCYSWGNYYGILENSSHRATTHTFAGCSIRESLFEGIRLCGPTSFEFSGGCIVEANAYRGLHVKPIVAGGDSFCSQLVIRDSYFEGNCTVSGDYQIWLESTTPGYIVNSTLDNLNINLGASGLSATSMGVRADGTASSRFDWVLTHDPVQTNIHTLNTDVGSVNWVRGPLPSTGPALGPNILDARTVEETVADKSIWLRAGDFLVDNTFGLASRTALGTTSNRLLSRDSSENLFIEAGVLAGTNGDISGRTNNGASTVFRFSGTAPFLAFGASFATNRSISFGSGTPEGSVTAPVGSLYGRTDGGAGSTLYVKESGAGNTGWIAK